MSNPRPSRPDGAVGPEKSPALDRGTLARISREVREVLTPRLDAATATLS